MNGAIMVTGPAERRAELTDSDPGLASIERIVDYGCRCARATILTAASDGTVTWLTVQTHAGEYRLTIERADRSAIDESGDPVLRRAGGPRIDIDDMIAAVMSDDAA